MKSLLAVALIACLIGVAAGLPDAAGILGSWTDETHDGDVGDAHFCADGTALFGTYGKQAIVRGTVSNNGQDATGTWATVGSQGTFSISTGVSNGERATRFEGSQQVVTNGRTGKQTDWNESRTPTGAQTPDALQCLQINSTTQGLVGTWFGGANPPHQRGPSSLYHICRGVTNDANFVWGSYDNGYFEGSSTDGQIFYGNFWSTECKRTKGDLILVASSDQYTFGYKWNKAVGKEYLGDVTLFRPSVDIADNLVALCNVNSGLKNKHPQECYD